MIGLDFGSDTMKVALVAPGAPLEIVTNFHSKRKTPTAVTFYRGERMFGADSMALITLKHYKIRGFGSTTFSKHSKI